MKILIALISTLLCFNIAFAGESLDQYFNFMGFTLEESKIADVLQKMGDTVVHKEGDAANSYTGVCYFYPKDKVTVYFESGEMGGGETILSYKVIQNYDSKYPCKAIDTALPKSFGMGNLKLGKDIKHTIDSLPPNIEYRKNLTFSYYNKNPFSKEDIDRTKVKDMQYAFWDQSVTIQLFSKQDIVTGYSITKITSW